MVFVYFTGSKVWGSFRWPVYKWQLQNWRSSVSKVLGYQGISREKEKEVTLLEFSSVKGTRDKMRT